MSVITVGHLEFGPKEREAVLRVLDSGRISEGQKTREFERLWANYTGTKYCVATSSGTASLITVLTALKYMHGLKKRPKVITSPLTYISDANAIVLSGLQPIFVDIDPVTFCITAQSLEKHFKDFPSKDYGIILPVDLMGYSVQLPEIKKIARKHNLTVVEDAAEAHGTMHKGKRCGSGADAGVFSFYIAHNISAGELGAITTDNHELHNLCRKIKANGRSCSCPVCLRHKGICVSMKGKRFGNNDFDPRFVHDVIGYNFKTMEFQTALACVQIKKVEDIIKKRQENVIYLNRGLEKFKDFIQLPFFSKDTSYLAYPLVIRRPDVISRRELRCKLEERRIETRPLFGCIPSQQPAYAYLKKEYEGKLPNADYAGKNGLYIGCHQYLKKSDLDVIIESFEKVLGEFI